MKPVHVGLLVVGAALAGSLAVRMTEPPPIPTASAIPANLPVTAPSAPAASQSVKSDTVVAPVKPSPLPPPHDATSPAPPVVYTRPAARPAVVQTVVPRPAAVPRRREIAQEKPLDVPPLPPDNPAPAAARAPVQVAAVTPTVKIETPAPAPAQPPMLHQATLRPGMNILVRIGETLSSDRSIAGNTFSASLAEPIVVNGLVIAERGARVTGRVLDSQKAGRLTGVSMLELTISSITTADGQRISIATDPWTKRGETSRIADAGKIGGGAALGAVVGALAGGGTGAAIGAGIGSAAGTGAVMATHGNPVEVPSETVVAFRVSYAVTITERRAT